MRILLLGKTNTDSWKLLPMSMPVFFFRGVLYRAFSGMDHRSRDLEALAVSKLTQLKLMDSLTNGVEKG